MLVFSPTMDGNSVLLFVGMVAGLFIYWKKGGVQASNEIIAMYKARDELQDKERQEMKAQITKMTGELGRLSGIIEEKDKRIKILESVDLNRNPVMAKYMEYMTKSMDKLNSTSDEAEAFMLSFKDLPPILEEIKTFMGNINKHMEQAKVA